jgi:hypothetical protein
VGLIKRLVLSIAIILFLAGYVNTPWEDGPGKVCLVWWNADGVHVRKLELEHFLKNT